MNRNQQLNQTLINYSHRKPSIDVTQHSKVGRMKSIWNYTIQNRETDSTRFNNIYKGLPALRNDNVSMPPSER